MDTRDISGLKLTGEVSINPDPSSPPDSPLNVRSEPNGPILGTLNNRTVVELLKMSIDSDWVFVVPRDGGGPSGWVFRRLLSPFIPPSSPDLTDPEGSIKDIQNNNCYNFDG